MKTTARFILLLLSAILLNACEIDSYETGDGSYSYLKAEFVEAHSAEGGSVDWADTDEGVHLILSPQASATWAKTPDSLYRALLYYNNVGETTVEPISISQVLTLKWRSREQVDTVYEDPLQFESAWISGNKKYLNIGFFVKSGQSEGIDQTQQVGILCDSMRTDADGKRHVFLRMMHHQNGVPQYYSVRGYASVPLADTLRDSRFHLVVPTYDGVVEKDL